MIAEDILNRINRDFSPEDRAEVKKILVSIWEESSHVRRRLRLRRCVCKIQFCLIKKTIPTGYQINDQSGLYRWFYRMKCMSYEFGKRSFKNTTTQAEPTPSKGFL